MFHRLRAPAALVFLALLATLSMPGLAAAADAPVTGKINLNTAESAQLELLPRVGPALAKRIIEFRQKNGSFKSTEELMLVRGIGEKTFEQMKPYLSISDKTTLSEKVRSGRKATSK